MAVIQVSSKLCMFGFLHPIKQNVQCAVTRSIPRKRFCGRCVGAYDTQIQTTFTPSVSRSAIWKIDMTSFCCRVGPIWIKFCRLVQNDMLTAMIWSKSEVEFQYGGRLGAFNGMSSQSHMPHCRV